MECYRRSESGLAFASGLWLVARKHYFCAKHSQSAMFSDVLNSCATYRSDALEPSRERHCNLYFLVRRGTIPACAIPMQETRKLQKRDHGVVFDRFDQANEFDPSRDCRVFLSMLLCGNLCGVAPKMSSPISTVVRSTLEFE